MTLRKHYLVELQGYVDRCLLTTHAIYLLYIHKKQPKACSVIVHNALGLGNDTKMS